MREVIGSGLAGRIRRTRLVGRVFEKSPLLSQRAINFIGGNVHKSELSATIRRQSAVVVARGLKQVIGTDDIRVDESRRAGDRAIDVAAARYTTAVELYLENIASLAPRSQTSARSNA
jgi:hypothetical protein